MMRGTLVPARKRLLALVFAAIAAAPITARADDGLVDVRTLPRLEGAVENAARTEPHHLSYGVPTPTTVATPAIEKLLTADGWMQYSRRLEESGTSLLFKRGRQGLFVSFTQDLRHPDQSAVSYDANRINANVPFPADATNLATPNFSSPEQTATLRLGRGPAGEQQLDGDGGRRHLGRDGCPGRRGDAAAEVLRRSAAAPRRCLSSGSPAACHRRSTSGASFVEKPICGRKIGLRIEVLRGL
jgi:hypothetical protein